MSNRQIRKSKRRDCVGVASARAIDPLPASAHITDPLYIHSPLPKMLYHHARVHGDEHQFASNTYVVEKNRESVASPAIPTGPERHAIEALSNTRDDFEQAFGQDHYYTRLVGDLLTRVHKEEERGRPTIKQNAYLKQMFDSMKEFGRAPVDHATPTAIDHGSAVLSDYAGSQAAASASLLGHAHGRQGRASFIPHVVTRFTSPPEPPDPYEVHAPIVIGYGEPDLFGEAPWPSDAAWRDWEDEVRNPPFESPTVFSALDTLHRSK